MLTSPVFENYHADERIGKTTMHIFEYGMAKALLLLVRMKIVWQHDIMLTG